MKKKMALDTPELDSKKGKKEQKLKLSDSDEEESEKKKSKKKDKKRKASEEEDEVKSDSSSEKKKSSKKVKLGVEDVEVDNPNAVSKFRISAPLREKLKANGIEALFPIQASTFDMVLDGADLVGRARTGQVLV